MKPHRLLLHGLLACLAFRVASTPSHAAEPNHEFEFQHNVQIPMRDGTKLAANLWLPKAGSPFPVILMRSPYGKMNRDWKDAQRYTQAGYAMVVQDCRGRGDSEGLWDPFRYDADDGFDTHEWVGQQPWCNGQIGTAGGSYVGWTQWAAAPKASRHLKAMVPVVPFGDVYHHIAYPGGALQLSLMFGWGAGVGGLKLDPAKLNDYFKFLPLNRWDDQFDKDVFYLGDWIQHSTFDDYWRQRSMGTNFESVTIPVLNIGGWYDIFSKTTIDLVDRVRERSKDRLARRNQFVVIGPWGHGAGGQKLGELDFGDAARLDVGGLQFQWFEYWLRGKESGVQDWPAYKLFVMGENTWRGENEWPLQRTAFTPYYLQSRGHANTRTGDGELSLAAPQDHPADTFTYDPNNPVPTRGGNNLIGPPTGPFDQASLEDRPDVLVYTSPPLDQAVEVTGPIRLILHAASTATDTDFTGKLIDVHPNGKAYNLCDGILRARYRDSFTHPTLIQPGQVYRLEIDLWATSNLFRPGHRIRLEISSSNFPRFDRNPNSGQPFGSDTQLHPATQTVYHDAARPSHLLLPIIPRSK